MPRVYMPVSDYQPDFKHVWEFQLNEPDHILPIPNAKEGEANLMQIWHDHKNNVTYCHASGEFSNQETHCTIGIISPEIVLSDYLEERDEVR